MAISGITITIDQGNNVGEVGSDSPLSLAQLSNITSTLRDAGLSSKEIIKVLEALLQLADEEQKKVRKPVKRKEHLVKTFRITKMIPIPLTSCSTIWPMASSTGKTRKCWPR